MRTGKRYVLMEASRELEEGDLEVVDRFFRGRGLKLKLIRPKGVGTALIAKTNVEGAAEMRERCAELALKGGSLRTTLVSGCIGKLKRRASGGTAS